jgi:hypothetical protein
VLNDNNVPAFEWRDKLTQIDFARETSPQMTDPLECLSSSTLLSMPNADHLGPLNLL